MITNQNKEWLDSIDKEIHELEEVIEDLKRTGTGPTGNSRQIEMLQKQIYDLEDEASEIENKMQNN